MAVTITREATEEALAIALRQAISAQLATESTRAFSAGPFTTSWLASFARPWRTPSTASTSGTAAPVLDAPENSWSRQHLR
jgi:hypothetical protein